MAKTHQACDKTALWIHNTPDTRKHSVFEGPGRQTLENHALEGPGWNPAAGGAHLVGTSWNNDLAFKSEVLPGF